MKTIVFIGTQKSGSSREAIRAAENMGYYTVLLTSNNNQIREKNEYPDVYNMIYCDLNNFNKIIDKINELKLRSMQICAIVSFIEAHCLTAALAAEYFSVNNFTIDAIKIMQNKELSRNLLKGTNLIPKFYQIKFFEQITRNKLEDMLPVIVKHPHSTGSKEVYFINDYNEYESCVNNLFNKYPEDSILVEEYINGEQYLIECLVINDELKIIAIIKQDIGYFNGHFIVLGYNLLINLDLEFLNHLKVVVQFITKKHGLKNGPCHLEMRYVNECWKLIEINPRISGAGMNKLLEIGLGINLVEETLKLAMKEEVDLTPKYKINTYAKYRVVDKSGVLAKVTGKTRAKNCKGVQYVFIKPKKGSKVSAPKSMGNRYAYVIATGENELDAKNNAIYAADKICFHLE